MRYVQQQLAELAAAELVRAVGTRTRPPTRPWFLTSAGVDTVESAPPLDPAGSPLPWKTRPDAPRVVGTSALFSGGVDWLRVAGVRVVDLASADCAELVERFSAQHPEIWREDIGA